MEDQVFEAQLLETIARINTLPERHRMPLLEMVEETRRRHQATRDKVARARDALDDWRLLQKYLVFDEEARQRETEANRDSTGDRSDH